MYDPIRDLAGGPSTLKSEIQQPSDPTRHEDPPLPSPTSNKATPAKPSTKIESIESSEAPPIESSAPDTAATPKKSDAARPPKRSAPDAEQRTHAPKSHAPPHKRARADSPPPQTRRRTPSPPPRSPPRQRKRPGAASRIDATARDALQQRRIEREAEQVAASQKALADRGSHDVVKQHYNSVPQRGREWRRTDSRIKHLRSFNNWVKSVLIQKFSPNEDFAPGAARGSYQAGLKVLDIGCGKGGDLGKWQKAPQRVEIYIGVDPAEVSIDQARERYKESENRSRGRMFRGHFFAKDGYGEWLGEIPIVRDIGIDRDIGPGKAGSSRWGGAGFDVVTMMFCMHYAFETEEKARGMLRNVAGSLKKGGRFIGVIPNSDVIREKVESFHEKAQAKQGKDGSSGNPDSQLEAEDGEVEEEAVAEWGNEIYTVRFPGETPADGIFRPPYGWKYSYFMAEAVEAPEYVVPWGAFRALAEEYNLEMQYRKPFHDVWKEERNDPELGELSMRMGVTRTRGGECELSPEEWEAVGFYHAFCFYRV